MTKIYKFQWVRKHFTFLTQLTCGCVIGFATIFISTAAFAATVNFTYDALNRLSKVTYLDNTSITYGYDAVGNWTTNNVIIMPDADADGIPDWWVNQYFGHPTGQAGDLSRANDDADGDGMTNLQEFQAGTNPKDAASVLRAAAAVIAHTDVRISFPTITNRTYRVEWSTTLNGGAWSQLPDAVAGDGAVHQVTDVGGATWPQRFYRVRLLY